MCGRPYPAAFGSEVELAEGSAAVVVTAAGVAAVAGGGGGGGGGHGAGAVHAAGGGRHPRAVRGRAGQILLATS
jgi:hypothetical protein